MAQGQGLLGWKHPSALSAGAIHHPACLSVGLLLTGAIYLNVIGSKQEGGGRGARARSWCGGSLGSFPQAWVWSRGAERWGSGGAKVTVLPSCSWEHRAGVKEARELGAELNNGRSWAVGMGARGYNLWRLQDGSERGSLLFSFI